MKQRLKTIEEMLDLFGEDTFYCISIYSDITNFQGNYSASMITRCKNDGYTCEVNTNGHIHLVKNNVKIILTD